MSQTKAQLIDGKAASVEFSGGSASTPSITFDGDVNTGIFSPAADTIAFAEGGSEAARIDSSGRLLVGTSSARNVATHDAKIQLEGVGYNNSTFQVCGNQNNSEGAYFFLGKSRGTTVGSTTIVQANDELGTVDFFGTDGSAGVRAARIGAYVDGTPGATDMPGRLVFSTTADGASSPTERMRIDNKGVITHTLVNGLTMHDQFANDSGYDKPVLLQRVNRSASTAYSFLVSQSSNTSDTEFNLRGDGNAFADGTWTGGGADYAEYFEWSDSNPDSEDRRGISVVLDGDKIREAQTGEDPIGVISGNPSVVGDAAWNKWSGKYLRDDFGTYVQEDYEVTDEDGNTVIQQRRKLNPAYDPDQPYQSREERPEWDCVGLMGKLRIRKGQVTGSRWIKMRDISATVEEWLVR